MAASKRITPSSIEEVDKSTGCSTYLFGMSTASSDKRSWWDREQDIEGQGFTPLAIGVARRRAGLKPRTTNSLTLSLARHPLRKTRHLNNGALMLALADLLLFVKSLHLKHHTLARNADKLRCEADFRS